MHLYIYKYGNNYTIKELIFLDKNWKVLLLFPSKFYKMISILINYQSKNTLNKCFMPQNPAEPWLFNLLALFKDHDR